MASMSLTARVSCPRIRPAHPYPPIQPLLPNASGIYDSETDGRARFMGHSAFEDPNTLTDAQKRESIEVRALHVASENGP
jgi:hypothetical protein